MVSDSIFADCQRATDLLVGETLGQHCQNLEFSRGQVRPKHSIGEARGNFLGDESFPRMNAHDRFEHLFLRCVFQQVSLGACLHGAIDILIGFEAGQDDCARRRFHLLHCQERVNPVHSRHAQIQQQDVGIPFREHAQCFQAAGGGTDDFDSVVGVQHAGQPRLDNRVIIHNEDPNGGTRPVHECGILKFASIQAPESR